MTYFLFISLPLLIMVAMVGVWLNILPYLAFVILIIFSATWMFG